MQVTRAVFDRMLVLLGADTATFNQAGDANALRLFKNDFAPGPNMLAADFDEADFDGYAAVNLAFGAQPQSVDPTTGDSMLDLLLADPAEPWETTGVTNLPQTIFGYFVTNEGGTTVLAAARFTTPFTLTDVNQSVAVGRLFLRQVNGSIE